MAYQDEIMGSSDTGITNSTQTSLLSCAQSLVKLELSLTNSLSSTKQLLDLPTPRSMEQVNTILSLASTYSTRTSAPPGWNPNLPVIHFSTPNPLPHQLRQGALGAMELNLVKEERLAKKRKIQEDLRQKKILEESKKKVEAKDPKKKEVNEHLKIDEDEALRRMEKKRAAVKSEKQQKKAAAMSMNLSDSDDSSEEDESDSY
jgi:hypothetical protein